MSFCLSLWLKDYEQRISVANIGLDSCAAGSWLLEGLLTDAECSYDFGEKIIAETSGCRYKAEKGHGIGDGFHQTN